MAHVNALEVTPEKHPFQIDHLPGPKGPFEKTLTRSGCFIRVDMPGVPQDGIKIFKRSDKRMVTFSGVAPSRDSFPFDESERVYGGVVVLNRDPNEINVEVIAENGSFFLLFPYSDGTLFLLPDPRSGPGQTSSDSPKFDKGEGSFSGKSTETTEGSYKLEKGEGSSGESLETAKGSGISNQKGDGSSSGKSMEIAEGSSKSDQKGEGSSSGQSLETAEGSSKSDQKGEISSSRKSIDTAEGSSKSEKGEISSSGKSTETAEGSSKPEKGEGCSSGKSIEVAEGSLISDQKGEGYSSGQPIETAEGLAKSEQDEGSAGKSISIDGGSEKSKQSLDSSSGKSMKTAEGSVTPKRDEGSTKPKQGGSSSRKTIKIVQGSKKSKQDDGSSSGKSTKSVKGSEKSNQGKGSSSGKSIKIDEGSEKSKQGKGSSSGKSIKIDEGLAKSKQDKDSSGKSTNIAEESPKSKKSEDSATKGKSIFEDEGSGKSNSGKSSGNKPAEDWMLSCLRKSVLQIDDAGQPEDDPMLVKTNAEHTHEAPEIVIGSVEECGLHHPQCKCDRCDNYGICLKTWSTTKDTFPNINKLKIKGPDGVLQKRLMANEEGYSLYLRADLPGLEEELCCVTTRDHCILVFGKPQARQRYEQGARNYLIFVQLRCTCFKFDGVYEDYNEGVLRLICQITGSKPVPPEKPSPK